MESSNSNKENYDPVRRIFSNSGEDGYLRQRVIKNTLNPSRKRGRNPLSEICTNILDETLEIETETIQEQITYQQEVNATTTTRKKRKRKVTKGHKQRSGRMYI
ncbi:7413_t:CDS:2 [Dentiscutata heterogama]|uniref:7413_t:CDS:1 n=1 Tax=Dentiscutata heterogama TaxID=1316150 RepID=A0ACA9KHI6_9GLOM|nr:7413_t:CDS:2 [Dentiscutata heterogama]